MFSKYMYSMLAILAILINPCPDKYTVFFLQIPLLPCYKY